MFFRLLLLFICVPLVDLAILLVIAKWTHWTTTVLLVILSGIVGAWLAKRQSNAVGMKLRQQLSRNQMPTGLLTDGAMILFAAGLLITPGLVTDIFGLSLLFSRTRNWYKQRTMSFLRRHFEVQVSKMNQPGWEDGIVDGEVHGSKVPASTDGVSTDQPEPMQKRDQVFP